MTQSVYNSVGYLFEKNEKYILYTHSALVKNVKLKSIA